MEEREKGRQACEPLRPANPLAFQSQQPIPPLWGVNHFLPSPNITMAQGLFYLLCEDL